LFPVIQCFHLLGLALLGGTELAVNMCMLGLGLRSQPSADLSRKLKPFMVGALAATLVSGILMFLSEAIKCYYSPPFWYKMTCLAAAIVFAFTVRRKVAESESGRIAPAMVKLTAIVSLALWFGVGFSGRWIAFY
jgi:hypothetical protein